ncbi:hypothetical protein UPYG_G00085280 [Umbra pygmaea]|uniref:Uncharacterized protein n=1 Tax=Umbra pygmaea TaxID=75934 RepID=A0ABD0XEP9_UMBPY
MGPGIVALRGPPQEHSYPTDCGEDGCLPDRLGSSLGRQDGPRHILVRTDNSSTVYHINHQGGTRSLRCVQVTQDLRFRAFRHLA